MKNEYFRLVKIHNQNRSDFDTLACIRKYDDRDIWATIANKYLNTAEYAKQFFNHPFSSMYEYNVKDILYAVAPDIIDRFKPYLAKNNTSLIYNDIGIYLASSNDYAKFDDKFANEMAFLEYIQSENAEIDKHRNITEDILICAGFEYLENESNICKEYERNTYGIEDYKVFRKWIDDNDPANVLKLDIDNGWNNRGTGWHMHIDNNACETIGSVDIDTVWQFNTLMQVFGSKFRL